MSVRVRKPYVVAEEGDHKFVWLGLSEADAERGVLTNQYMIVSGGEAMLIDPGGYFVFERVLNAVTEFVRPDDVVAIFYSHQDPDVVGSLNLVTEFFPNARIYISRLWVRFLPHLGALEGLDVVEIPDEGMEISIGGSKLVAIPAHFLHSPGQFTLYDPVVRVLFSSDIGAAVFPKGRWYLFVENFEEHVKYMEPFHRRYLACTRALRAWLKRVRGLEVEIVAPQHGAIFVGENVRRLLDWLESLGAVGAELLYAETVPRGPR